MGHRLDPEEKICYLNVRPLTPTPDSDSVTFDADENLELLPLDLTTMTSTGRPLTGHKGYSIAEADPFTLNCIYPDVTKDYVGCGSEDNGAICGIGITGASWLWCLGTLNRSAASPWIGSSRRSWSRWGMTTRLGC